MISMLQERPPYVRFQVASVEGRDESGQPVMKDVEHVLVTPAGSKDVHVALAESWIAQKENMARQNPPLFNPQWAQQFRASYELWRKGVTIPEHGTAVRSWPVASPSEVKRCIDANVLTVEDLAVANEPALNQIGMGARALKEKAAAWITQRDGPGKTVQEIASLRLTNEELMRRLDSLEEANRAMAVKLSERERKPRVGRPAIAEAGDAIQ